MTNAKKKKIPSPQDKTLLKQIYHSNKEYSDEVYTVNLQMRISTPYCNSPMTASEFNEK